jgi:hypothetical protein
MKHMSNTVYEVQRCIGLWGRLFGHRFKFRLAQTIYDSETCSRCGIRRAAL